MARRSTDIADPYGTARDTCYRLLATRARTKQELRTALLRKGIGEDVADDVLDRFDRASLIDDEAFAESWVRSRHEFSGMSRRAMVAELRAKGVDGEVAASAAAEIDDDAEAERARALVRKKIRATGTGALDPTDPTEQAKLVRRLVGVLARKGYGQGLCYRVIREELQAAGIQSAMLDSGAEF